MPLDFGDVVRGGTSRRAVHACNDFEVSWDYPFARTSRISSATSSLKRLPILLSELTSLELDISEVAEVARYRSRLTPKRLALDGQRPSTKEGGVLRSKLTSVRDKQRDKRQHSVKHVFDMPALRQRHFSDLVMTNPEIVAYPCKG